MKLINIEETHGTPLTHLRPRPSEVKEITKEEIEGYTTYNIIALIEDTRYVRHLPHVIQSIEIIPDDESKGDYVFFEAPVGYVNTTSFRTPVYKTSLMEHIHPKSRRKDYINKNRDIYITNEFNELIGHLWNIFSDLYHNTENKRLYLTWNEFNAVMDCARAVYDLTRETKWQDAVTIDRVSRREVRQNGSFATRQDLPKII